MPMRLNGYGERAENLCAWPRFPVNALVFGVELEVEPRAHSSQGAILEALPSRSDYFCKEDGSLNAGVEIVTVPGTLEWHRYVFDWSGVLRGLLPIAMSGSRTQRCGMHIHVNRRAMSPLTLAKMYLFINEPNNMRFMESIAQRSNNRWAAMAKKKWGDCTTGSHYRNAGRYQALNLTTNGTAELRLFRGTIRADRVLKNIEFAHALVSWCRDNSATDIQDWRKFVSFVALRDEWPVLAAYIQEIGVAA
jgi:hypothetical protein